MLKIGLFNLPNSSKILPLVYSIPQWKSIRLCSGNPHPLNPEKNHDDKFAGTKGDNITKASTKKPEKPPFVKNLFVGNFDTDMLKYPQIADPDRYAMLQEIVNPIESFYEEVDSEKIDREGHIPAETLQGLKELGLYGLQIPEDFGGLGLTNLEYARICEVLGLDGSICLTLSAHQSLGVAGLLMAGSEEQKRKYLPKLASGDWTAALCVAETDTAFDAASIQTTAVPTDDGKGYRLTGTKSLVVNGGAASLLNVVARVRPPDAPPSDEGALTLFLTERNFGGVSSGEQEDKWGARGADITEVRFDNTFVPSENVLGQVGDGFKLALSIINSGKFAVGSSCAGALKNVLKSTIEYVTRQDISGSPSSEFSVVKDEIARASIDAYVMESMAYLTAGLMDNYEEQDCAVELAIVKIFSSEKVWEHIYKCFQLLGGSSFVKQQPFRRILRDNRIAHSYDNTNDIMRLFIGLSGLELAGKDIFDLVEKLRNPLMHPYFIMKTWYDRIRYPRYDPKLDMDLHKCVHPTLGNSADRIEYSTKRFRCATEDLLGKEGANVVLPSNQLNVKRMADVAIDLYAMTAVIARASRSEYLQLDTSTQETHMANYFIFDAAQRIKETLGEVSLFSDESGLVFKKLADSIFEKKGYPIEPTLTRTFW